MSLHLLEITVTGEQLDRVPGLLANATIIELWITHDSESTGRARVLVDARHTEALSDLLVSRFGSSSHFRIVSLPVEATLPPVEPPPEEPVASAQRDSAAPVEPARISREELYADLSEASEVTPVYLITVALSTIVAAVGLVRGDVAIVIGAMLIAPLLGPNVGLALASTLGDPDLAKRALLSIGAGIGLAAALSLGLGLLFEIDPSTAELLARTHVGFADVVLALAAGTAGTLAFTSGVPAVLVGVMVAVALLPPLVVAGLFAGSGHSILASHALLLLLTNVTCVNLAAIATFLAQRVRPRTWWEEERAKRATRLAASTWAVLLLLLLALIWLAGRTGA